MSDAAGTPISLAPASWGKEWPAASCGFYVKDITGNMPQENSPLKVPMSERDMCCFAVKTDQHLRTHLFYTLESSL